MKRTIRKLGIESLEPRLALSGNPLSDVLSGNAISPGQPPAVVSESTDSIPAGFVSERDFLGSSQAVLNRWDWLADTSWYVPVENLLAYSADEQLADPTPLSDQTLWSITQSDNGLISGNAIAKFSSIPIPSQTTFTGVVTPAGQVRMDFVGGLTTTGIGQMRFVDGVWTVQMQMATGTNGIITHWAYMCQVTPGTTPPEPNGPPLNSGFLSNEWRWMEGTDWALTDTELFGSEPGSGVFQIESYRNGYFWGSGSGEGNQQFNVLGSVTPEGNLLFLFSQEGTEPALRTGMLTQTGPASGMMSLRWYEGQPEVGSARTIADTMGANTPNFASSL